MRRVWIPQTIVSLMMLWALNPDNPYSYYIILRWVSCGVFAYLTYLAITQEKQEWAWVLGITAVLYNPIFRTHLEREVWSVINIATIGIALASIFFIKARNDRKQ